MLMYVGGVELLMNPPFTAPPLYGGGPSYCTNEIKRAGDLFF